MCTRQWCFRGLLGVALQHHLDEEQDLHTHVLPQIILDLLEVLSNSHNTYNLCQYLVGLANQRTTLHDQEETQQRVVHLVVDEHVTEFVGLGEDQLLDLLEVAKVERELYTPQQPNYTYISAQLIMTDRL